MLSDENRALLRLMRERQPYTVLELAKWSGQRGQQSAAHPAAPGAPRLGQAARRPDTRAVRPEALATEFLVVLD